MEIKNRIEQAKKKLLNDREVVFQAAQELGVKIGAQRVKVEAEQRKLAEMEEQYKLIKSDLQKVEAQISICEQLA